MKKFGMLFIFAFFSTIEVHAAEEAVVIEVRKNISMSKTDKVYKNYFINGGSSVGLAKGATVDVLRRLPVHDPLKNSSIGDIRVKVGQLEIIHSDPKISVARMLSSEPPENRPFLDYEAVMVGDRLDLGSIHKPKLAQLEPEVTPTVEIKSTREVASVKKAHPHKAKSKKAKPKKTKV